MARVRGRVFQPIRAFVKEQFGEAGWSRVLSRLAPEVRQVVDGLIVPESWYDIMIYHRLISTIHQELGEQAPDVAYRLGQYQAQVNVPLFHRMLLKVGSPEEVFTRAAALWKEYFDHGRVDVIERGTNHYRLLLHDQFTQPYFVRELLPGWAAKVIEMTGRKVVESRFVAVHEGDPPAHEIYVEWR